MFILGYYTVHTARAFLENAVLQPVAKEIQDFLGETDSGNSRESHIVLLIETLMVLFAGITRPETLNP